MGVLAAIAPVIVQDTGHEDPVVVLLLRVWLYKLEPSWNEESYHEENIPHKQESEHGLL